MPPPTIVDRDIVVSMSLESKSQGEIGRVFGVTRQRISQVQDALIAEGKLPPKSEWQAVGRPRGKARQPRPQKVKTNGNGEPTWEQVKGFILSAIEQASQVPELQAELAKYKRGYSNAVDQLKLHEKSTYKERDEELRYKVALQQGQINPPKMTYDIDYEFQPSISDKCLPGYIILEALSVTKEYNIIEPKQWY